MPLAKIAARCMAGKSLAEQGATEEIVPDYYSVKEAIFPFAKFQNVDPILGPEMRSTGEVMGVGRSFGAAFARAEEAANIKRAAARQGLRFGARSGQGARAAGGAATARAWLHAGRHRRHGRCLAANGIACERVNKVIEGRPHIVDLIKNGEICYIVNTTEGRQAIADSFSIRREALQHRVTYSTTMAGARALAALAGLSRRRRGAGAAGTAQGVELMSAPITAKGAARLRSELEELKSVKRPAVIDAIAEARAHGDLKENAEYHAAREQQGFIEGRIKQLEGELSHAQVIDVATLNAGDKVVFGATVRAGGLRDR